MKETIALGIVAGFIIIWIGFAVYCGRRGWSRIIAIGGGFLAACAAILVVALIVVTTTETPKSKAPIAQKQEESVTPQAVSTTLSEKTAPEPTEPPAPPVPPKPKHFYAIQDGTEYGYEQAVSDEARRQGQVASKLVMFKFLGEREGALQFYNKDGEFFAVFQCERPCEYVKQMVFFDRRLQKKEYLRATEGSIVWAVSRDALNGSLKKHTSTKNGKVQEGWFEESGPKWRDATVSD